MFAYIAGSPFAYITFYHVPAQAYGLLFGLGVLGIMATNLANAWAVKELGSDRLLRLGALGASVAAVVVAVAARTGWGGLVGLAVPLFVFLSTTGFIVANSIAGALALSPKRSGVVSALIGSIQYGGGIVGSALVGGLADGTPWPMGCVIAVCGVGSLLCTLRISTQPDRPSHSPRIGLTRRFEN